MKKFEELTDKELLNLTEEQLKDYVHLRMMEEDIKIAIKPVKPVEPKRIILYKYFCIPAFPVLYFNTYSDAQKFLEYVINNKGIIKIKEDSYNEKEIVRDINKVFSYYSYKIEEKIVYEKNLKEEKDFKNRLSKFKEEKDLYLQYVKIYQKYEEEYIDIANKAYDRNYQKQILINKFKNIYLKVNDNFDEAMKYFKKVENVNEELEKELKNKLKQNNECV